MSYIHCSVTYLPFLLNKMQFHQIMPPHGFKCIWRKDLQRVREIQSLGIWLYDSYWLFMHPIIIHWPIPFTVFFDCAGSVTKNVVNLLKAKRNTVASNPYPSRESINTYGPSNRTSLELTLIVYMFSLAIAYRIATFSLTTCSTPIFRSTSFSLLTHHVYRTRSQAEKEHGN